MNANRMLSSAMFALLLSLGVNLSPAIAQIQEAHNNSAQPRKTTNEKPGGGMSEGMKVHGHWTIELRNPDGTLAARYEFENALSGGNQMLSLLLGRSTTSGRWELNLAAASSAQISACQGGTGGRHADWCRIIESAASNPKGGNAESTNLQVSLGSGNTKVILAGSITALVNGVVSRVSTSLGACPSSTTLANCNQAGSAIFFTDASPNAVPVVAGQIIQVTVVLSFS